MWWHRMPGVGFGWLGGLGMLFGNLLFLGLLVLVVVWLARSLGQGPRQTGQQDLISGRPTPLDIVRERYARGEITREEFERLREDLQG
ncbi:MAG: SHOCT domain-containing protein [Anaerolineae bacterium]